MKLGKLTLRDLMLFMVAIWLPMFFAVFKAQEAGWWSSGVTDLITTTYMVLWFVVAIKAMPDWRQARVLTIKRFFRRLRGPHHA